MWSTQKSKSWFDFECHFNKFATDIGSGLSGEAGTCDGSSCRVATAAGRFRRMF